MMKFTPLMKSVYKEAVKYIQNHNISIEDCISDNLNVPYDEFSLNSFATLEDKKLFLRIIFINVKINQCDEKVLKFLFKSESKDKDVLFVLFNLIKKLSIKGVNTSDELQIIQKCKNYWSYKFLRGVLVQIFTLMSNSKHYFEVLPLDFIIRYGLWTKNIFFKNGSSDSQIDLDYTIESIIYPGIKRETTFNVFLIVKFLQTMNFMNYKYLRKTLLILDLEMFDFLPVNYTELGLINLISIINEYRGIKNKKGVLKKYLNSKITFDIPFLRTSHNISWAYNPSITLRKVFLESIESFDVLYEFVKCNQYNEDLEMIDTIVSKVKKLYEKFSTEILTSFKNLIKHSLTSIFPYRRLLGLKLLEATKMINKCSQDIIIRAVFDKSQVVRNYSKMFVNYVNFTAEDLEKLLLENKYNNVDFLFDYINERSIDIKNLLEVSRVKVEEFADGRSVCLCHNLLRFFIVFQSDSSNELIDRIRNKFITKDLLTSHDHRLIRELCVYYYLKQDINVLIEILLNIDDLGVILTINKYLKDLKVNLSESKIHELIDTSKYNNNWIRKSAGLGILFKSLSYENKKFSLNLAIKNIKAHMDCRSHNECENILYHNFSILLSIIDDFTLTIELLDLCFRGIGSTSWIVKNNSLRIFKVVYDKTESIEMNEEFRSFILKMLKFEVHSQNGQLFNNTLFCLTLLIRRYESVSSEESEILTTIEQSKSFLFPNLDADEYKNTKYIFEINRTSVNENTNLTSFLREQKYSDLKKWLLVFISEDEDQKSNLFEDVFDIFRLTHEKIIHEIIQIIVEKNKIDTLLKEIQCNNSSYDLSYIHFVYDEIAK